MCYLATKLIQGCSLLTPDLQGEGVARNVVDPSHPGRNLRPALQHPAVQTRYLWIPLSAPPPHTPRACLLDLITLVIEDWEWFRIL